MKRIKKLLMILFFIAVILIAGMAIFIMQPSFGKLPYGTRPEQVVKSPHFVDGAFKPPYFIRPIREGISFFTIIKRILIEQRQAYPKVTIPSIKHDLKAIPLDQDVLIWLGHSSYYIQVNGKRFLIDPVLSSYAAPVFFVNRTFDNTTPYAAEDFPIIDYLLITHDHYDHLDYRTIKKLKKKVRKTICGLGVGEHFLRWGYPSENIIELDWYQTISLGNNFTIHTLPTKHFSGRFIKRNPTLFMAFALQTPDFNFFLGGDGGYHEDFKKWGSQFGPFDWVILENGQYNKAWKDIHMMPEQTVQAAIDLRGKTLLPVHNTKYALAFHSWDAPIKDIEQVKPSANLRIIRPMIGDLVFLRDSTQQFERWWEGLEMEDIEHKNE
jgi:L-ascorbate metabolism protein UlaG (beta-lactamase superfamily)